MECRIAHGQRLWSAQPTNSRSISPSTPHPTPWMVSEFEGATDTTIRVRSSDESDRDPIAVGSSRSTQQHINQNRLSQPYAVEAESPVGPSGLGYGKIPSGYKI